MMCLSNREVLLVVTSKGFTNLRSFLGIEKTYFESTIGDVFFSFFPTNYRFSKTAGGILTKLGM